MPKQLEFDFEKGIENNTNAQEDDFSSCSITGFSKERGRIYGFLRVGSENIRFYCDVSVDPKSGKVVGIGDPKLAPGLFHYESIMSAVTKFVSCLSPDDVSEIDCAISVGRF